MYVVCSVCSVYFTQDIFDPQLLYALPFEVVRSAPTLQSLLRGGLPSSVPDIGTRAGKIVEDIVDLSVAELDPEYAQPNVVVHVQHISTLQMQSSCVVLPMCCDRTTSRYSPTMLIQGCGSLSGNLL